MIETNVFDRLVEYFGTARKFAEVVNVKPQSVTKWRKQIPAERVREIEHLTNGEITRYEMRPDVFGTSADDVFGENTGAAA